MEIDNMEQVIINDNKPINFGIIFFIFTSISVRLRRSDTNILLKTFSLLSFL